VHWFPKCNRRSQGFTDDPWIHYCNGHFVDYLLFKPKEFCFVKNNRDSSLVGEAIDSQNT
jgi:hypothetical protein